MKPAAGWYVLTDDLRHERYWNGSMWQDQTRRRQAETPYWPEAEVATAAFNDSSHEERVEAYLQASLTQQARSANYLAILTYITVVLVVLGIVGVVIAVLAVQP